MQVERVRLWGHEMPPKLKDFLSKYIFAKTSNWKLSCITVMYIATKYINNSFHNTLEGFSKHFFLSLAIILMNCNTRHLYLLLLL